LNNQQVAVALSPIAIVCKRVTCSR